MNNVINKSIGLSAPKENVWRVLTEKQFTDVWYSAFSEGTQALTD